MSSIVASGGATGGEGVRVGARFAACDGGLAAFGGEVRFRVWRGMEAPGEGVGSDAVLGGASDRVG
uniref:Uncharacterized protein n=1 Tax=Oryza meridionalis TaxID=40149 RepID=A0A0E0D2W2_9ORYZ